MKFMKNKKSKICIVLLVTLALICCVTNSYAQVNSNTTPTGGLASFFSWFIDNIGIGVLGTPFALLVNAFSAIIFLILYLLFCGAGITQNGAFPFPDQIVFNKVAILDPNFINPATGSIGNITGDLFGNLYSSFFVLATTIFTIAALVIGIKLVFSSLAAEKAQYKKALNTWIVGIVMLFLVHYLLAGMFYLNEQIVEAVSVNADKVQIKFDWTDAIPFAGKTISKIVNGIANAFGGATSSITDVTVYGFGGVVTKYFWTGLIGQNFISAITFLIIIGQTFALVISYLKRAFMCIILGVMAPVVVAIDVIQKSLK